MTVISLLIAKENATMYCIHGCKLYHQSYNFELLGPSITHRLWSKKPNLVTTLYAAINKWWLTDPEKNKKLKDKWIEITNCMSLAPEMSTKKVNRSRKRQPFFYISKFQSFCIIKSFTNSALIFIQHSISLTSPTTTRLKYTENCFKLFAVFTADWPASMSLHHFILLFDGSHQAAGKHNTNQLKRRKSR